MKKLFAFSTLLSIDSATVLSVDSTLAQFVPIPIPAPPPAPPAPPPAPPVPPVSGDFLAIGSNLQIANPTLPSSDKINPEYRQEYNNDFSRPRSSRILPLDIE
jgi:hypothetical protein